MGCKMNDHDLLIKIERDLCYVKKRIDNHVEHHWKLTLAACTAAIGGLSATVFLIVKHICEM